MKQQAFKNSKNFLAKLDFDQEKPEKKKEEEVSRGEKIKFSDMKTTAFVFIELPYKFQSFEERQQYEDIFDELAKWKYYV